MNLAIELEQETDGRWIAEIDALDGVLVYGENTRRCNSESENFGFSCHCREIGK